MSSPFDDLDTSRGATQKENENPVERHASSGRIYDQCRPLIDNLGDLLQEVRVGSSVLDDADDIKQGLLEAYRALKVVNMVNGQNLIAIAGPQGAGKTSTVKWIYDLPDGYLPIGTVTGEKLPVLIIEQEKDSIDPFAHRYHPDSGKMTTEEISKEKCRETAGSPDLNDIAVEIRVPSRFFEAEGRGFLLLPGVQRKSDMHVRLARHVLPSATTALICIDDAQLAKGSVDEEFTSVRDGVEVEETHLIYALTKPRGGEKTKEAAQTLRDRFSADEDQVVVVEPPHADGEEDTSSLEWTDRLRHAVDQYVAVPHEERRAQLDTLRDLLDNLEGTMETLHENLRQAEARASRTEREQARPLLEEFDQEVDRQREILDTHLETALNGYVGNAIEEVRDRIQDESFWDKIKSLAQSESLEKKRQVQSLIENSWREATAAGPVGRIADSLNATTQDTAQDLLGKKQDLPRLSDSQNGSSPQSTTDLLVPTGTDQEGSEEIILKDETVKDIKYLFGRSGEVERPTEQLLENVRRIPAIALESVRLGLAVESEARSNVQGRPEEIPEDTYKGAAKTLKKKWKENRDTGRGMLKGVAGMLGLDYAPDAELESLEGIATMLGGGSTAPLVPVVGVIGAGYVATTLVRTVREDDLRRDRIAQDVFDRVADQTRLEVLEEYDRFMQAVRQRLQTQARKRHNLGTKFRDRESIKAKAGSTEKSMRELRKSIPQRY